MKKIILLIGLFTSLYCSAQDSHIHQEKKWYVPEGARLQFAGEIGMFSVGPTWLYAKKQIELTHSVGFVPEFAGGKNILVTALKCEYTPRLLDIRINDKITIKPLSFGLFISLTWGKDYWKYHDSKQYPTGYYWWNTAYRIGFTHKIETQYKLNSKHIDAIGLYWEAGTLDLYIMSRLDNDNAAIVKAYNIMFMSLGIKTYLR